MKLSQQELAFYRQCINEVLRGFHIAGMEKTVGISYAALMKEDAAFYALSKAPAVDTKDEVPIPVRSAVIAEAIRLLGVDDFHTRTGLSLDEGYDLLEKVKKTS